MRTWFDRCLSTSVNILFYICICLLSLCHQSILFSCPVNNFWSKPSLESVFERWSDKTCSVYKLWTHSIIIENVPSHFILHFWFVLITISNSSEIIYVMDDFCKQGFIFNSDNAILNSSEQNLYDSSKIVIDKQRLVSSLI